MSFLLPNRRTHCLSPLVPLLIATMLLLFATPLSLLLAAEAAQPASAVAAEAQGNDSTRTKPAATAQAEKPADAASEAEADKDKPVPGYVDSAAIKARFKDVTAEDMEMLRGKKILFASRSFGLNLGNGLRALAREDKKYEFLSSYQRYDVFKAGGDVSIIPADAFKDKKFVHFLATYWPHTKRVEEVDQLLRAEPHEFGKQVDVVIIFFHIGLPQHFEQYSQKMDAWRRDFPDVKFIYVTAGFLALNQEKYNQQAHAWSELVRQKYKGKVPLYDLGKILSDDFRVGLGFCPEYSRDPAGVHPNLPAGETMMAKGFLLVLKEAFAAKAADDAKPDAAGQAEDAAADADKPAAAAEKLAADHPDYKAVRAILDANGLKDKAVEGVAVAEGGRVTKLYLQEGGTRELPAEIGALSELRVLHVYGDRNLDHPLLEKIDPAIGRCTKLEELLLNSNNLSTLPTEITALVNLKSLSLADNRLRNLPPAVKAWAEKFDARGLAQQNE